MRIKLTKKGGGDKLIHNFFSSCLRNKSSTPICFIRTLSTTLPQELLRYMSIQPSVDDVSGGRQPHRLKKTPSSAENLAFS